MTKMEIYRAVILVYFRITEAISITTQLAVLMCMWSMNTNGLRPIGITTEFQDKKEALEVIRLLTEDLALRF